MKRKASRPPKSQPVKPTQPPEVVSTAVSGSRNWLNVVLLGVAILVGAGVGYYAANRFGARPAASKSEPGGIEVKVVLGDGVNGPAGMVWVPGGDFLMGSDSKMAQPNE